MMEDSFQSRLYRFAARHVAQNLPPWTAAKADDQTEDEEEAGGIGIRISLGMPRSIAAPLGDETWTLEPAIMQETKFSAAIYRLKYGPQIGFIRIPRYQHDPKRAEVFGDLIRRFETDTDALLIDQQYNRGGSLLQMYAMCSYLTDRPLPVPLHQVKLWENDVPEAEDVLERQQYGDELPDQDRPSPYEIAWANFVIRHAKLGKGVLSDPVPLFGISQIEPANHVYSRPIFLLSNHLTFSAGEFLAAILKDNGRAILLGRNTAGAGGCVRVLHSDTIDRLIPGMSISLTWTVGWRRNGFAIENTGISPDIEIRDTIEDVKSDYAQFRRTVGLTIAEALHEPKGISVLKEMRDARMQAETNPAGRDIG